MKTETGVMVMKDGKGWGKLYDDGRHHEDGWVEPEEADIHNPDYCRKVTDAFSQFTLGRYREQLVGAKLVRVMRLSAVAAIEVVSDA
jgi:hypothetical protein